MSAGSLITVEQLGKTVKAKYPAYASKSDTEVGQAVLKKYPQYSSRVQPAAPVAPKPEDRTVGNYLKEGAYGVGRGLRNDATGIAQTVAHPIDTVEGMMQQANESGEAAGKEFRDLKGVPLGQRLGATALAGLEKAPVIGGMVQKAEQGGERMASPEGFGAAMEGVTTFAAPELAGKGVAKFIKKAPDAARAVSGTGPSVTADLAKETKSANDASAAKASEAKAVEDRRGSLQRNIHEQSRELQGRIETARNNALKEGNEKYAALSEKLNAVPADSAALQSAVAEASEKLKGSETVPPILKSITSRLNRGDFVEHGGMKFGPGTPLYESVKAKGELPGGASTPLGYKDLQGYYSELGTELSKGNLPGDVYKALDTLHESIGEEMQKIADSKGLGQQLTDARNYWRKMKQTFGRPPSVRDAATKTLNSLSPEFAKQEKVGNAVRLLGDYDPEIAKGATDVTEARKSLKSLPKAKPTEAVPKKIGVEDIQGAKLKSLQGRAQKIRSYTSRAAMYVTGYRSLIAIGRAMTGDVGALASLPADIAEGGALVAGGHAVASFLENPKVANMLTRATPADVAQIPPEMRGDLGSLVQAAQKKGIKVAPALLAATTGAAVGGQSRKGVSAALSPTP